MISDITFVKCKGSLENYYHKIEIYFLEGLSFLIDGKIKCAIKNLTAPQASTISSGSTFLSSITPIIQRPKETEKLFGLNSLMELNFSIEKITEDVSFIKFSEPSRLYFNYKINWLENESIFFEVNSGLFLYIKTLRNKFHNGEPIRIKSDEHLERNEYYLSKKSLSTLYDPEYDTDSVHQQYVTAKTKLFLIMDQVMELDKLKENMIKLIEYDGVIYKSSSGVLKSYEDVDIIKPLRIKDFIDSRDNDYDNLFSRKKSEFSRKISF